MKKVTENVSENKTFKIQENEKIQMLSRLSISLA